MPFFPLGERHKEGMSLFSRRLVPARQAAREGEVVPFPLFFFFPSTATSAAAPLSSRPAGEAVFLQGSDSLFQQNIRHSSSRSLPASKELRRSAPSGCRRRDSGSGFKKPPSLSPPPPSKGIQGDLFSLKKGPPPSSSSPMLVGPLSNVDTSSFI